MNDWIKEKDTYCRGELAMKKGKLGCFGIIAVLALIFLVFHSIPSSDTTNSKVASSNTHTVKKTEKEKQPSAPSKEENNQKTDTPKSNTDSAKKTAAVTSSQKVQPSANTVPVTLTRTVDGDTIKVMYNGKEETVRYLLVDTPEEKKPGTCVQNYAVSAYNKNKQLVNSGKLSLEFETNGDKRDKYGRLLAYVFVNGKSVQEELLKDGYARVAYIYNPPYKYLSKYQSDEKIAENKHLNIWSLKGFVTDKGFNGCASKQTSSSTTSKSTTSHSSATTNSSGNSDAFVNNPADDKESNLSCKGKIKGNANSKIYHMPGDAYYDKTKDNIVWFCTESQAQTAGYRHSKR